MKTIRRLFVSLSFLVFVATHSLTAQVIQTKSGPYEFLGLKRWTAERLLDSIEANSPGAGEHGPHACGAVLTGPMGFADAAVLGIPDSAGNVYWVVMVIEPEDSARVEYLPLPERAYPSPEGWRELAAFLEGKRFAEQNAIDSYARFIGGDPQSAAAAVEESNRYMTGLGYGSPNAVEDARTVWEFLRQHLDSADRELALHTLKNDRDRTNRHIAVLILSNFPGHDDTWHALLDAQRDGGESQRVGSAASTVLQMFARDYVRTVDWRAAASSIRAYLAGTNLFAFPSTLELLSSTRIDPSLAGPVLRGNVDLLNAWLYASHPAVQAEARKFVGTISGNPDAAIEHQRSWLETFR